MTLTAVINPVVPLNLLFPLQRVICPQSRQSAKYRIFTHNFTNDDITNGKSPSYQSSTPYLIHTGDGGSVVSVQLIILSSDQPRWNSHPLLAPILPLIRKVFWVSPYVWLRLVLESLVWDGWVRGGAPGPRCSSLSVSSCVHPISLLVIPLSTVSSSSSSL